MAVKNTDFKQQASSSKGLHMISIGAHPEFFPQLWFDRIEDYRRMHQFFPELVFVEELLVTQK